MCSARRGARDVGIWCDDDDGLRRITDMLFCSLGVFFYVFFFGIEENREGLWIGKIEGIRTKIRSEKSSRYEE